MRFGLSAQRTEEGILHGERTIGDIARIYSVSLRTLRFYEDKGLLSPRRQGTARFYSANDRVRLELILRGKRLGFTLAEIFQLIASRQKAGPDQQDADLTVGLGETQLASQIAHLQRQRDDLDIAIDELRGALARMAAPAGAIAPGGAIEAAMPGAACRPTLAAG